MNNSESFSINQVAVSLFSINHLPGLSRRGPLTFTSTMSFLSAMNIKGAGDPAPRASRFKGPQLQLGPRARSDSPPPNKELTLSVERTRKKGGKLCVLPFSSPLRTDTFPVDNGRAPLWGEGLNSLYGADDSLIIEPHRDSAVAHRTNYHQATPYNPKLEISAADISLTVRARKDRIFTWRCFDCLSHDVLLVVFGGLYPQSGHSPFFNLSLPNCW